jgi:transcriptional regulator with XRE-family HTH domain
MSAKKQSFQSRLKEARIKKGLSQAELSKLVGAYVSNISRYERGEHYPATEMLSKLAEALDVTTDFLMSGSIDDKATNAISDKELLSQFQRLEKLPKDKKHIIKEVIEAYLFKAAVQQLHN